MSVLHLLYPIIRRNRISFAEIWLTKCCVLFSSAFVCFVTTCEICLQMLNACVHSLKIAFQEVCQRKYQMTCGMESWNSFSKAHYPRLEVCCTKTKIDAYLVNTWRVFCLHHFQMHIFSHDMSWMVSQHILRTFQQWRKYKCGIKRDFSLSKNISVVLYKRKYREVNF